MDLNHRLSQQTISLLAQGLMPGAISRIVGLSIEFVEEIGNHPGAMDLIQQKRAELALADAQVDEKMDDLEQMALDRMRTLLPISSKLTEVTRAFAALNQAKRRHGPENAPQVGANGRAIVSIDLPANASAIVQLKVTSQKEVVEIGDRSLIPLESQKLRDLVDARKQTRLLETVDVPRAKNSLLDRI